MIFNLHFSNRHSREQGTHLAGPTTLAGLGRYRGPVRTVHEHQARSLGSWLTSALHPESRWQSFTANLPGYLTWLHGFRPELRSAGIVHLSLAEEDFLPDGLKQRVLCLAWWPGHQHPALLPDNPGVSP